MKLSTILLSALLTTSTLFAAQPPSAFQSLKVAEASATKEARGKLIEIHGPRDSTALTPSSWSFIFFDPSARQQGRRITVRGENVTEIRDGYFQMDEIRMAAYKLDEVIDPKLLKVDSKDALATVVKSAELKDVKLSTVTFSLSKDNSRKMPLWKLVLFADKEGKEAKIGHALVSAENGAVVESKIDLSPLSKKKKA